MSFSLNRVNTLSEKIFTDVFGNVIELCSGAAIQVQKLRPFKNIEDLCNAFQEYLDNLPQDEKLIVLKLHPDLAGKLASQGKLTKESTNEQKSAGLDQLTNVQRHLIETENERYKNKFGFPFIICARENKVESIIKGLQTRFNNTKETEIITGINEVKKICKLRIMDIVKN